MGERRDHIIVYLTPKSYLELNGEGIDYFWACSKNHYRLSSFDKNKGKKSKSVQ